MEALDVKDACRHYLRVSGPRHWSWLPWHRRIEMWIARGSDLPSDHPLLTAVDDLSRFALACLDYKHREVSRRLQLLAGSLELHDFTVYVNPFGGK